MFELRPGVVRQTFDHTPGSERGRSSDDRALLVPGGGWEPFGRAALGRDIPARFAEQARRHAGRAAVRTAGQTLTYAQLAARADQIAQAILHQRGDQEEPVALLLDQSADLAAAILGTLAAGKIFVPLDPAHPDPENERTLADCQPALLLTSLRHRRRVTGWRGAPARSLVLEAMEPLRPEGAPGLELGPDRLASIFYTSGSTGQAKGVADSHGSVLHNIMRYTDSLRIGCEDRLSLVQSCTFSGMVSSLFGALLNGACVHLVDLRREGIGGLAVRLTGERLTVFHSVPAIFRELVAAGGDLASLRVIRVEGDIASASDLDTFRRHCGPGCMLVNGLGATETGLLCQYFVAANGRLASDIVPVGYPAADVEVVVVDEAGDAVASGVIGEIVVHSRWLAAGYWRNPTLTDARFRRDPDGLRSYRTGDLGRCRPDGALELLGRRDLQVKLHGKWVDTAAVAAALLELGPFRNAIVLPRELRPGRPELVAWLVPVEPMPKLDISSIRRALAANHPQLPNPSRFCLLDALPLDRNGKVDRARLPSPRMDTAPAETSSDPIEAAILVCWSEVLQRPGIDVQDGFAASGGDSFAALELALLLEQRLGMPVPPDAIGPDTTV